MLLWMLIFVHSHAKPTHQPELTLPKTIDDIKAFFFVSKLCGEVRRNAHPRKHPIKESSVFQTTLLPPPDGPRLSECP